MSILEEVAALKNQQQEQAEKKHREGYEKARSLIPAVAEQVKELVVKKMANSKTPLQIKRVGLFKRVSFYRVVIGKAPFEEISNGYIFKEYPELHEALIAAITDKGFSNVSIEFGYLQTIVTVEIVK
ncbi:MAG: hypothetical protein IJ292_04540 [Clostridia bacterium]|nr:hypothetical protein [Clostridia bacterium]